MPKAAHLLAGIVVLATACGFGSYAGIAITTVTMGVLGGVGEFVSTLLPLVVAAALFWRGTVGRKSGYQLAPFVFFIGWALVSVSMRAYLSVVAAALFWRGTVGRKSGYQLAPFVFFIGWALVSVSMRAYLSVVAAGTTTPATDPGLAKIRTLVVDDFLNTSRTFVSEGIVDRLVEVAYENNDRSQPIRSVRQTTLAFGQACTDEDKARSAPLRAAGRSEECFKETMLPDVPDGLHVLLPADYRWGPNRPGELVAVAVSHGQRTEALRWRRVSARVPAYIPLFRMNMGPFDHAQTIWETRSGPFEVVSYGDMDLAPEAMAGKIYAFDPSQPPKPKSDSPLLAERAYELASAGDLHAALRIVTLLDKTNFHDDNMIRAAAYNIFVDANSGISGGRLSNLGTFADKLTIQQRKLLNGQIIRILTTPAKCRCRAFLFNSTELGQRAIDAFLNTSGLEQWQYDGLLTATMYVATPFADYREKLLGSILDSHDPSNGRRMASYLEKARFTLRDAEMRALTRKLTELDGESIFSVAEAGSQLIPPARLEKFSRNFDPRIQVTADTWVAFWVALRAQAKRIPDAEQRRQAIENIEKQRSEG